MLRPLAFAVAISLAIASTASADDEFAGSSVVFARGSSLYRVDPRGKLETEIATLPANATVRALRTDAGGRALLVDLDGTWSWMPLDASTKQLTDLPCGDGPAELAEDGTCVLCRAGDKSSTAGASPQSAAPPNGGAVGSVIVNLVSGKTFALPIPAPGARITGAAGERRLVWSDKDGVWLAPPGDLSKRIKVAPEAPLRGFTPSPDGARALGVYSDTVFTDTHHTKPAEVLMSFQLDGQGARRKSVQAGVPVQWSHDSQWVLLQDHASACDVHATGGEYKCWKGYTAVSIAADGKWALVLGNRDGSKRQAPAKNSTTPAKADEDSEGDDATPDVAVPLPSGPQSLYRTKLEGAFTDAPVLIVKVVDGAAVWVPAP